MPHAFVLALQNPLGAQLQFIAFTTLLSFAPMRLQDCVVNNSAINAKQVVIVLQAMFMECVFISCGCECKGRKPSQPCCYTIQRLIYMIKTTCQ